MPREQCDGIDVEADTVQDRRIIPVRILLQHLKVVNVLTAVRLEQPEGGATIVASGSVHHFSKPRVGNVLVQLRVQLSQPLCSPPHLCNAAARQRASRVSANVLAQHGLLHAVLVVTFPRGCCTKVAHETVPRDSAFAEVRRAHRVLASVPSIVSRSRRHHEGALNAVFVHLRRSFEQPASESKQAVERKQRDAPAAIEGDGEHCTEHSTEQEGEVTDEEGGHEHCCQQADGHLHRQVLGYRSQVDGGRHKNLCSRVSRRAMPILATAGHVDAQVIGASGGVHNRGTARRLLSWVVGDERIHAQRDHEYDREGQGHTHQDAPVGNGPIGIGGCGGAVKALAHPMLDGNRGALGRHARCAAVGGAVADSVSVGIPLARPRGLGKKRGGIAPRLLRQSPAGQQEDQGSHPCEGYHI